MYEPIIEALRRGAAADALSAARDAVSAQPLDAEAQRWLSAALRLDGDREGALAAIDEAIALAPEDSNLHFDRAGLLLNEAQLEEAQAALARAIGLDPNQFPAYIVQAQLALGRGDLDEAERIARTAARIAPDHAHVSALEGMLALRRGDADRALSILTQASVRAPDDWQLRNALGFAYLAKGHFAFAEQAFRSLLEQNPTSQPLRMLLADVSRRQGRVSEAVDQLLPLLDEASPTPALLRVIGELELEAGRLEPALARLRKVLAVAPNDRRTLTATVEAWRRLGAVEDARSTLDDLLVTYPQVPALWDARLAFEPFAGEGAGLVVDRWLRAMPEFVPAMEARLKIHDQAGEAGQAEAIALRLAELVPGHGQAELRVIEALLARDPDAAMARVEGLLARAEDEGARRVLRQLLGRILDVAGQPGAAAATWAELHAEAVTARLPLPAPIAAVPPLPDLAPIPEPAPAVLLLWGAPGSLVERLAVTFQLAGAPLRVDRFGPQPPQDPLQRYATPSALVDGTLDGAYLVAQWRAGLPARGVTDGNVLDWLLWWDNALLLALRPHLPEAVLMIALRDPRDMLLEWLAYGSPAPFALESPVIGARWLAEVLAHVAELHEQDLFPHRLVRLDIIADDPVELAQAIGDALEISVPAPPARALGPQHFAPGHWRAFAEPLASAFALLTPVAQRLGYPEA